MVLIAVDDQSSAISYTPLAICHTGGADMPTIPFDESTYPRLRFTRQQLDVIALAREIHNGEGGRRKGENGRGKWKTDRGRGKMGIPPPPSILHFPPSILHFPNSTFLFPGGVAPCV
jgi:hypothetical protein